MRIDRMIAERERAGFKQAEFAREIGVSKQMMNAFEKGTRNPSGNVVANMAKALGCSTDYLLGLSDERA